ncbi:MAG: hypothetical protein ACRC5H_07390 [Treponemataceae bacterium]
MYKFFVFLFFLTSCSVEGFDFFSGFETVVIALPEIPSEKREIFSFSQWSVSYFDQNHKRVKKSLPPWQKDITLHLPKNQINPILVTVELLNSRTHFMPAGCLYPYDSVNKKMNATWHNGFATQIADTFLRNSDNYEQAGYFLMQFNWLRLQEKVQEFENPWLLDDKKIIDAIAQRKVSIYSFKEKSTKKIDIPAIIAQPIFYAFMPFSKIESEIEIFAQPHEITPIFANGTIYSFQSVASGKVIIQHNDF